ncbi:MAG: LytTR family transcriptional regulator DNA-binding domain-containing protein [Bacteroidales bacterium]|nr:LytTR family transcriptional regulator DNA-binding domain-containing protein [Candidatus Cacconaster scatequi]
MEFFKRKLPAYITDKTGVISMLVFTAVFALVFINAYRPFNVDQLYPTVDGFTIFLVSSLLIMLGLVVVAVSRFVLYHYASKHVITYLGFGFWIIIEILLLALVYARLACIYIPYPEKHIWSILLNTIKNTFLVIVIPYTISVLYIVLRDYSRRLKALDELRLASLEEKTPETLTFYDYKGEIRFSIKRENFLYVEACDNYVNIWYMNKGRVEHFLLRSTLKALLSYNMGDSIRRCHRSYIVNFDNVNLIRRDKDGGVYADFGVEGVVSIPVSSTYAESISGSFLK